MLSTKNGDVELHIPSCAGAAIPVDSVRRRRIDGALLAAVVETYVHGVSTRKVDDLVAVLRPGEGHLEVRGQSHLPRA